MDNRRFSYTYSVITDVGRSREANQDAWSYLRVDDCELFVLADGMGGQYGGETASALASNIIPSVVAKNFNIDGVAEGITKAHEVILALGGVEKHLSGMGTTVVCLLATPVGVHYAHVGDSRLVLNEGRMVNPTYFRPYVYKRFTEAGYHL